MRACLVHHADAVGPHVDSLRPLSHLGRRQAEWIAAFVRDTGFAPVVIWHSGKLRSKQTAEAFLHVFPMAEFRMVRGLRPEDPPEWIRDELAVESRDVLLVGHMPHLPGLAHALIGGSGEFPQHGVIGVARDAAGGWTEFVRTSPKVSAG